MATIEWRGRKCPLVLCKRVGSRLIFRCRHCSKVKGEPVYHDHGNSPILPRHDFAMCEDPSSPYHRTGYVLAIEPPRTREELTRRIARALLNKSPVPLTLYQVETLTEVLVEALADPRWGQRPTAGEVMSVIVPGYDPKKERWAHSGLRGVGF